jgi:DNA polymerase-3 subunit beta
VRFRVERDVLAEVVAWAARTLPSRPPVPVLAGVLVEAGEGSLTLSSFDYEVSARCTAEAVVEEQGSVLVSGRLLAEIARSLPARPVTIATDEGGHKVEVSCGSARFTLPTLPVDEYPALPDLPAAAGQVDRAAFAAAVEQVALAAGRDDTLPVLTGVRIELAGETMTLAATDRYRLAVRELAWRPDNPAVEAVALVPARTLRDAAKAFTHGDSVVVALATGAIGEGLMGFEGSGRRTTTRLLDGEFPKYRSLLPTETTATAQVSTAELQEAVQRVALVAERNTPVRLSFTAGELVLDAGTGDEAQASETLEATLDGDPITIAFNPAFLLDGLRAIDAPTAHIAFVSPTKPAVLSGGGGDGPAGAGYRYLLMPVRLAG